MIEMDTEKCRVNSLINQPLDFSKNHPTSSEFCADSKYVKILGVYESDFALEGLEVWPISCSSDEKSKKY